MAGPNTMLGYYKMPTETANMLRKVQDGKTWLYTGDIATMDEDGYFYIVDRKKDMALIGGFNVYPTNIEKVLKDHPAVLEVGVAAVPHRRKRGRKCSRRGSCSSRMTAIERGRLDRTLQAAACALRSAAPLQPSFRKCPRRLSARRCAAN